MADKVPAPRTTEADACAVSEALAYLKAKREVVFGERGRGSRGWVGVGRGVGDRLGIAAEAGTFTVEHFARYCELLVFDDGEDPGEGLIAGRREKRPPSASVYTKPFFRVGDRET